MKYGAITKAVLEHLAESGKSVIDAFLTPQHPGIKFTRTVLAAYNTHYSSRPAAKHSLSSTLYRLRKEGLVASIGPKKKMVWTITKEGQKFLKQTATRSARNVYALAPEDRLTRLVTFDIPEPQQKKRRWLHAELLACGFHPLHKSVFIGKRPLPGDFIKNLRELNLGKYVHIVGIEKSGTLAKK